MKHTDSSIIDQLGGNSVVADLCEISSQAVSKWRKGGVPKARRMYLQLLRKDLFKKNEGAVRCEDLRNTPTQEAA